MSERDALLRGILEQPECDTARLVYADWCDENGQPARAEFIRVQCELAKCGPCPATIYHPVFDAPDHGGKQYIVPPPTLPKEPCGWCPVCVLRVRERVLLRAGHLQWWRSSISFVPRLSEEPLLPDNARYRRGFVTDIACAAAAFFEHAAVLFAAHPLVEVALPDYTFCAMQGTGRWILRVTNVPFLRQSPDFQITYLPAAFKPLLTGGRDYISEYGDRVYDSESDARSALSRACVAYGRIRAQLTPLPSPQVCVA